MKVVGTAGHVDHGKSTLVRALTGINPDRLQEEQEREMTIDLGFAWMDLPNGEAVGIVDVPGHIDFIDNMLAGVGGIDAALLVIAADEGVMPQTREHLAILTLLEVKVGVVAISKSDLVQDPDWMDLVIEEVRELLQGTSLADAPILPVSAVTGAGLERLRDALQEVLARTPERPATGEPRLPVDRSFSLTGFGTIVTGTLLDGEFQIGDEVLLLPAQRKARIRGLQTHKEKIEQAHYGSRVAMNLTGIEASQVERGDVVVRPGTYRGTKRFDARFQYLSDASSPIKHNQYAKLYHGAAQRSARIRLLGKDELLPGDSAWLQIELDRPIVAARGDRFILRRPSPGMTLGGGRIVDPYPERRYRRYDENQLTRLEKFIGGTAAEQIVAVLHGSGPLWRDELRKKIGFSDDEFEEGVAEALEQGTVMELKPRNPAARLTALYVDQNTYSNFILRVRTSLEQYHQQFHLRAGIPAEELRSRLGGDPRKTPYLLEAAVDSGMFKAIDDRYSLPLFKPQLSGVESQRVAELMVQFRANPFNTPSVKQAIDQVGDEVLTYLVASKQLIQLGQEVLFQPETYSQMEATIREQMQARGTLTVADVRDFFQTSRKYALAILEDLDARGITIREGDARRLLE
ncbi:MAG: selenocysteine-specific translation elongation factor [Anaerolineales bacterium]